MRPELFNKVFMEKYILDEDVKVLCVKARSFPEGVLEAFQTIENLHPSMKTRTFYGISNPDETGKIIYKAAVVEAYEGEGAQLGLENFVVEKGEYMTETIMDFTTKIPEIGLSFQRLLTTPGLDLHSSCIEWYKSSNEVMCMVKLTPQ